MIQVTRLDNSTVLINADKVQSLHAAPDTVITFTNNAKMIVREQVNEISKRILEYQRLIHSSFVIEAENFENSTNSIQ